MTTARISSPTGKKNVGKVLLNLVLTSCASWNTRSAIKSMCFELHRGNRPIPGAGEKREGNQGAISPLDIGVARIVSMTRLTCSRVRNGFSRRAVATRPSFSERLKYSASVQPNRGLYWD